MLRKRYFFFHIFLYDTLVRLDGNSGPGVCHRILTKEFVIKIFIVVVQLCWHSGNPEVERKRYSSSISLYISYIHTSTYKYMELYIHTLTQIYSCFWNHAVGTRLYQNSATDTGHYIYLMKLYYCCSQRCYSPQGDSDSVTQYVSGKKSFP